MTRFVKQHATVIGNPRYPLKELEDIKYFTGTRVYRVIRITQHIPRLISLSGRQIKCIYDGQPDHQSKHTREQQSDINSNKFDQESITDDHSNAESDSEQDSVNKPIPKTNRNQKKKLKQTTKTNLADRKPRTITLVKRKYLLK